MSGQLVELWTESTLGELFEIVTGTTPSKSKAEFYGDYMPFIKPPELLGGLVEESADGLSELGSTQARVLPPESVLVSCIGNLGKLGINSSPVAFNQQINAIKPNYELANPKFVFYYCMSNQFREQLHRLASGTTVLLVNKTKFKSIKISLPSLNEQQRIVRILDKAFNNIENQTRKTEQKMNTGDGLLHSYIHKIFSEGGENWTEKTIEETCKLISGQHILAADYNTLGNGIGYLTGPADFGIENPVIKRWTEKPKVTAIQGDILITVKGSGVGKINRLSEDEVAISRQLMAIRSNGEIDGKFLFYFISIQYDMFQGLATGAAIPGISRSDVLKLQIPYPPLNEQIRIIKRFDDFTNQSQEFSKICDVEIDSLSELKQSILQEAFNGTLRIAEGLADQS